MKPCKDCGVSKPLTDYYRKSDTRDGYALRCKPCHEAWRRQRDPLFNLRASFFGRRRDAEKSGIPFSITLEDLLPLPEHCPVLGIPLLFGGLGGTNNSPSIDRIVPSLGYVPGNVIVMSLKANRIKNDATLDELEAVANFVRTHSQPS